MNRHLLGKNLDVFPENLKILVHPNENFKK